MLPCAASTLVSHLLDQPVGGWREAARTSVSVHYETNDCVVPVVCVATPAAVRLPHSLVVPALPAPPAGPFRPVVTRWWTPDRPTGLTPPHPSRWAAWFDSRYDDLVPGHLVGRGPGLTPAGDDVLAGALVAARAVGHPGLARGGARPVRR